MMLILKRVKLFFLCFLGIVIIAIHYANDRFQQRTEKNSASMEMSNYPSTTYPFLEDGIEVGARAGNVTFYNARNITDGANDTPHVKTKTAKEAEKTINDTPQIEEILKKIVSPSNTIIYVIVEYSYISLFQNFYAFSKMANVANFVFAICKDISSCRTLREMNVTYFPDMTWAGSYSRFGSKDFKRKNNEKTDWTLKLLELGYNVLMSDVDIVLFKDPFPYMTGKCKLCDIHIGTNENIEELNAGFVLIRNTPKGIETVRTVVNSSHKKGQNQDHWNGAIRKMKKLGLAVNVLDSKLFPCGKAYFDKMRTNGSAPHEPKVVMIHNNYLKSSLKKVRRFKSFNLWFPNGVPSKMFKT